MTLTTPQASGVGNFPDPGAQTRSASEGPAAFAPMTRKRDLFFKPAAGLLSLGTKVANIIPGVNLPEEEEKKEEIEPYVPTVVTKPQIEE